MCYVLNKGFCYVLCKTPWRPPYVSVIGIIQQTGYTCILFLFVYYHCGEILQLIISPKFEISGILWFWSGHRLRRLRLRRRTPRLVFHVTATPMRVSNSYLTQPLIPRSGRTLSILEKIGKPKWPPNGHFVKI